MTPIGSTIGNSIPSQQESLEEEEEIVEEGETANSTAADSSEQVPVLVFIRCRSFFVYMTD